MEPNALDDKRAAGEALWAAYCYFSGISYLQSSENFDRGMDFLAAKFHCADRASIRQHQPELCNVLAQALPHHPWRCYYFVNLILDDNEVAFALNTFWKGWAATMDERWQNLLTERQHSSTEAAYAQYDQESLFAAVLAYMEAHRDRTHTYNEVAKRIQIKAGAIREIMLVKDALERLCDPRQKIYRDVVRFPEKRGQRTHEVYRFAPARRLADSAPQDRGRVVSGEIMAYLDASPYKSVRDVERYCRDAFGRIDNKLIRECLAALVRDKVALCERDPRGAHLHYPNPKMINGGIFSGGSIFG